MAAPQFPWVSVEEYLEQEALSDTKHTYYAGTVFAMAGGSVAHGTLMFNLGSELRAALRGRGCRVMGSDVLFQTANRELLTYPDVMVLCGPVESLPGRPHVVTNPVFVAEVLSRSTASFDRGEKSREYRLSPSLRAYALLSQDRARVEVHTRSADGEWVIHDVDGLENELYIPGLECRISMAALYEGVLEG